MSTNKKVSNSGKLNKKVSNSGKLKSNKVSNSGKLNKKVSNSGKLKSNKVKRVKPQLTLKSVLDFILRRKTKLTKLDYSKEPKIMFREVTNLVAKRVKTSKNKSKIIYKPKKRYPYALKSKREVLLLFKAIQEVQVYVNTNSPLPDSLLKKLKKLPPSVYKNIQQYLLSASIDQILWEYKKVDILKMIKFRADLLSRGLRYQTIRIEDLPTESGNELFDNRKKKRKKNKDKKNKDKKKEISQELFGEINVRLIENYPRSKKFSKFLKKEEEKDKLGVFKNISDKRLERLKSALELDFYETLEKRKDYEAIREKKPIEPRPLTAEELQFINEDKEIKLIYDYYNSHEIRMFNQIERLKKRRFLQQLKEELLKKKEKN